MVLSHYNVAGMTTTDGLKPYNQSFLQAGVLWDILDDMVSRM